MKKTALPFLLFLLVAPLFSHAQTAATTVEWGISMAETLFSSVPPVPSRKNLAAFLCEQHRRRTRHLQMLNNPCIQFLDGMQSSTSIAESLTRFDSSFLAPRPADSILASLIHKYASLDAEIASLFSSADSIRTVASEHYLSSDTSSAGTSCSYFNTVVPPLQTAVKQAMSLRRGSQLDVAMNIDLRRKMLERSLSADPLPSLPSFSAMCAAAYFDDASRLTNLTLPR